MGLLIVGFPLETSRMQWKARTFHEGNRWSETCIESMAKFKSTKKRRYFEFLRYVLVTIIKIKSLTRCRIWNEYHPWYYTIGSRNYVEQVWNITRGICVLMLALCSCFQCPVTWCRGSLSGPHAALPQGRESIDVWVDVLSWVGWNS